MINRLIHRDDHSTQRVKFIQDNYDKLYTKKADIYMHTVQNDDLNKAIEEIEQIIHISHNA